MNERRTFILLAVVFCGVFAAAARAQEADLRDQQVAAAIERAVGQLFDQVARTPIDHRITVGEFLTETRGKEEMLETLHRAQQIGGPRWVDEQTCQVQLEISGARVARTLSQLAASKPQRSPIAVDVLELRLADWRSRTFSTTASSIAPNRVEQIVPAGHAQDAGWQNVSDEARRQAIGDAKYDAVINVFDSIAPIRLNGDKTIGDAMAIDTVAEHVHQWFASRPVTKLEFDDNLEVEIALSAPADEIATTLRAAMEQQSQIPPPTDEQWNQIANQIASSVAPAVGRGGVDRASVQTTQANVGLIANQAPEWIDRRLTSLGTAPRDDSKLRSARAAETDAIKNLEAQVRELPLSGQMTIAHAARQNGRVEDAIQRGLRSARVLSTDYARPDGSVGVTVELELRRVWEELLRGP